MKRTRTVLFLDPTHPALPQELEKAGYRCVMHPDTAVDDLVRLVPDAEGIIVRSRVRLDEQLLQHARALRFIGRVGSGLENIDVDYARGRGIACLNSPEGNRVAVGEHAAGMLLALVNKICRGDREVRRGLWRREENRGTELSGKVMGIIGYGNTGSAFARCLEGFGMEVLAFDKYRSGFGTAHVAESALETLLSRADVISFHVPLTEETQHMADAAFFARCANDILLINTSRGPVVRTCDLLQALDEGKVRGAALDVLEYEHHSFGHLDVASMPEGFRRLAACPNVVLTPHVAGWTHESAEKLALVLARKILSLG